MAEIRLDKLCFSYDPNVPILEDIDLVIDKPELICILGANGAGKSTLMHCMNKLSTPTSGDVFVDGKNLKEYRLKDLAKIISFVPHQEESTFSMSVLDTVLMGRIPHSGNLMTSDDIRIAAENLKLLEMQAFAMRNFDELSAGQHQKDRKVCLAERAHHRLHLPGRSRQNVRGIPEPVRFQIHRAGLYKNLSRVQGRC